MATEQLNSALAILRRKQVETRTGLSRSAIYSLMLQSQFPEPVKLTAKAVGWPEHVIEAWIASRIEAAA